MIDLDRYQILFPMGYLILAAIIACVFKVMGVPDGTTGLIIGAALTRVKMPAQKNKEDKTSGKI